MARTRHHQMFSVATRGSLRPIVGVDPCPVACSFSRIGRRDVQVPPVRAPRRSEIDLGGTARVGHGGWEQPRDRAVPPLRGCDRRRGTTPVGSDALRVGMRASELTAARIAGYLPFSAAAAIMEMHHRIRDARERRRGSPEVIGSHIPAAVRASGADRCRGRIDAEPHHFRRTGPGLS